MVKKELSRSHDLKWKLKINVVEYIQTKNSWKKYYLLCGIKQESRIVLKFNMWLWAALVSNNLDIFLCNLHPADQIFALGEIYIQIYIFVSSSMHTCTIVRSIGMHIHSRFYWVHWALAPTPLTQNIKVMRNVPLLLLFYYFH